MSGISARVPRLQAIMRDRGTDLVILGPYADMAYFTGVRLPVTERFNAVAVPADGPPYFVVPRLQRPLVPDCFEAVVWDETDDPISLLAGLAPPCPRIAIDGRIWSLFLLGLQHRLPRARFEDASALTTPLRIRKDAEEIAILAEAGRRFDAIWTEFFTTERLLGRTEFDVRRRIGDLILSHGFESVSWCDVGSGPNGASPLHHGSTRVIEPGDPVVIDFAGVFQGYVMDTCRTPVAGQPHPDFVRIYDTVNAAYEAAEAAIRPGMPAGAVDAVARDLITAAGHGPEFLHRLGHGLGLEAHEPPYLVAGNELLLEPGMVFSDEPGIYVAGRWGVRIENILLVGEAGATPLTNAPRRLVTLE